jgi:hypothetical protein
LVASLAGGFSAPARARRLASMFTLET